MATLKERFLQLFYSALKQFEDETGVEIHGIRIDRIDATENPSVIDKTVIDKYHLDLK